MKRVENEPTNESPPMDVIAASAPTVVPDELVLAQNARELADQAPFAIPASDFLAQEEAVLPALLGTTDETFIGAGSLNIMAGSPEAGKTTLTLDGIAHMGSGTPWLDQPVDRPVRFLMIENEGSRAKFRQKLAEKVEAWQGKPFTENVMVYPGPWGQFSLADDGMRSSLAAFVAAHKIDVVVCDTLDSIGMEGVGSPAETRKLHGLMKECGLGSTVAFLLLHHFNKGQHSSDSLDKLQGAWGGAPDTVVFLKRGPTAQSTQLMWRKLRYATPQDGTWHTLKWDVPTRGYEYIEGNEPIGDEVYEQRIITFLGQNPDGVTKKAIEEGVVGKTKAIREALERLVGAGRVENEGSESRPKFALRTALEEQQEIPF